MTRVRDAEPLIAAARVALVTTAIVAALYAAAAGALVTFTVQDLSLQVDQQLGQRLAFLQQRPLLALASPGSPQRDVAGDLYVGSADWVVAPDGSQLVAPATAPALPAAYLRVGPPTTAAIGGQQYRLVGGPLGGDWLVVGVQTGFIGRTARALAEAAALVGLVLLGLTFFAALAIGRWSAAPVERARRQVLEFTADASHELRTPLQVIEAEVSLALLRERDAASYRAAIENIGRESDRLRRLVDDLLWLARFDSRPRPPQKDMVDLAAAAAAALERFRAPAVRKGLSLRLSLGPGPAGILAPSEWVERLLGVLLDNACRHTPPGGTVRVAVQAREGQAELRVEDSGPGIPPSERGRIFQRFHRAVEGGGAGLGLAIGDAVVSATGGSWPGGDFARGRGQPGRPLAPGPKRRPQSGRPRGRTVSIWPLFRPNSARTPRSTASASRSRGTP